MSIGSLRTRLVLSHLAVVAVGAITLLVIANRLAPSFVDRHVQSMDMMTGSMMSPQTVADIKHGALSGFDQVLLVAAAAAALTAVIAASLASTRLLRPIGALRSATRRLAGGSYSERVPPSGLRELGDLADDVNTLASTLEQTETRRTRLVSEVAHELRTPLATIKGYLEGLVDGVFPADQDVLAAMGKELGRIERLATDLGELSRNEEGRPDLRLEPSDLFELAREAGDRLRSQFDDQGVTLEIANGPSLPVVVDRDRIAQVFTNIIGNALTYTPAGGLVTIASAVRGEEARVTVSDTGRGLDPTQIGAVFERFYRGDRAAPGGTGIGLTIARGIARRHGGDVEANSPGPGRGSAFTVVLPLRAD